MRRQSSGYSIFSVDLVLSGGGYSHISLRPGSPTGRSFRRPFIFPAKAALFPSLFTNLQTSSSSPAFQTSHYRLSPHVSFSRSGEHIYTIWLSTSVVSSLFIYTTESRGRCKSIHAPKLSRGFYLVLTSSW